MFTLRSLKNLFQPKAQAVRKADDAIFENLGKDIQPLMPSREEYRREGERYTAKGRNFG